MTNQTAEEIAAVRGLEMFYDDWGYYIDVIAKAHTKQRLTAVKEKLKDLDPNYIEGLDGKRSYVAVEDVKTLIEEELQ